MRARPAPATPLVVQISDVTSGACPFPECAAPAYPFEVDGVDGPFHACPAHCCVVALDRLWDPSDHDTIPCSPRTA